MHVDVYNTSSSENFISFSRYRWKSGAVMSTLERTSRGPLLLLSLIRMSVIAKHTPSIEDVKKTYTEIQRSHMLFVVWLSQQLYLPCRFPSLPCCSFGLKTGQIKLTNQKCPKKQNKKHQAMSYIAVGQNCAFWDDGS